MFRDQELVQEKDNLRKFACKLTKNECDADDLLQSTLLRALEKKKLYKTDKNLFGWTSKIMFNLFASQYRRRTKFETQYDPENFIEKESTEASQEIKVKFNNVGIAMEALSDDHRQIINMVCIKGMKYKQVSSKLGVPVGTVRSRLSRARQSLKHEFESIDNPMPYMHKNNNKLSLRAAG